MQKWSRTSGFTLVEVLVSVMLTGIILTAAYSAFQGIMKSQIRLNGAIDIQRNLFYLNEKLASLIHNGGTLDYEEYFNRRMLGYKAWFVVENTRQLYTFTSLSKYGNGGTATHSNILLCGRDASLNTDACLENNAVWARDTSGTIAFNATLLDTLSPKQQAYWQYASLAYDYSSALPSPIKLPSILPRETTPVWDIAWDGLPELYLIKKIPDGSYERVFFRHIFIQDPTKDAAKSPCDPSVSRTNCLGKIQMTRLKSCDIVNSHGWSGSDGTIDAWIPLPDFTSSTTPTTCSATMDFSKAADTLTWVDITTPDMNIVRASFLPSPDKVPRLMAGAGEVAESPIIQMHIEAKLSENILNRGLLRGESNVPHVLISTFDLSD